MMQGWQSELMDRKVVLFGVFAAATSPTTAGCSRSCNGSCSRIRSSSCNCSVGVSVVVVWCSVV